MDTAISHTGMCTETGELGKVINIGTGLPGTGMISIGIGVISIGTGMISIGTGMISIGTGMKALRPDLESTDVNTVISERVR
jgi:hypothetical protein